MRTIIYIVYDTNPTIYVMLRLTPHTLYVNVPPVNAVQEKLAGLEEKGWTLAAIADEVGVTYNAVQKWKAGTRRPSNARPVLQSLDNLLKRKRIPGRRRHNTE